MIGILSDSHDNLNAVGGAVRLFKDTGCNLIIHAGDFVAPFAAQALAGAGCPIRAVFGNCDGDKFGLKMMIKPFGTIRKAPFSFNHAGKNIALVHFSDPVEELSAQGKFDLIVFGHSHRPEIRREGRSLIINPGETGGWVTKKKTVALYDPSSGTAEIRGI